MKFKARPLRYNKDALEKLDNLLNELKKDLIPTQSFNVEDINLGMVYRLIFDIYEQSTRKNRASGLKEYLKYDLDFITRKAEKLLKMFKDALKDV